MKQMKKISAETLDVSRVQKICMIVIGMVTLCSMVVGNNMNIRQQDAMAMWLNIPAAIFLGTVVGRTTGTQGNRLLLLGLGFMLWMAVLELISLRNLAPMYEYAPRFGLYATFCEYMMLLPWACITDDKGKNTGLKLFGGFLLAGTAVYIFLAMAKNFRVLTDPLVNLMQMYGDRLGLMWYPNVAGLLLMLGIGFALAFACEVRSAAMKVLLLILTAFQFLVLLMTDSRTTIGMTACILAGAAVLVIADVFSQKKKLGPREIKALAGIGISAALIIGCWILIRGGSRFSSRSFWSELGSFNGRTDIWKAAWQGMLDEPLTFLIGTDQPGDVIALHYDWMYHCHNTWMNVLMRLGVVGLGFSLVLTWLAVKNAYLVVFRKQSSLFQRVISLVVFILMVSQSLEIFLFFAECPHNIAQMCFMLMTGYLVYWGDTLPDKSAAKAEKQKNAEQARENT